MYYDLFSYDFHGRGSETKMCRVISIGDACEKARKFPGGPYILRDIKGKHVRNIYVHAERRQLGNTVSMTCPFNYISEIET